MSNTYRKRIVDQYVQSCLESMGALLIEGAKWCGKTRTSEELAKSALYIEGKQQINSIKLAIDSGIKNFLDGDTPRLIDEWQEVPEIWDAIRFEVDHRHKRGQFILTGSSVPPEGSVVHSGAGRIARVTMRPMSLFESGESNGQVSLRNLFDPNGAFDGYSELTVDKLANALTRGGWPESLLNAPKMASWTAAQYVDAIVNSNLSKIDGVVRDPVIIRRIIESVSRNISTFASMETIRKDINGARGTVSEATLADYLKIMERTFMIEPLPAWNPHIRSRTRLMKTPKWHFVDPSIATAALNVSSDALLMDYNAFGFLFESLCVRDLRIYSQPLGGNISYFRNKNGNEVDIIVGLQGGKWGAIEAKLGDVQIEEGAKSLLRLRDDIDTEHMEPPSFLMVLTGGRFAYRRPDGVLVVPIGCLRD